MKAPFPWFGGKSRAAPLVWDAFGDVVNYVEPFAGSLAVLLGRPTDPGTETVNDADCYLANFWRALSIDPDAVADGCAWPVNEADLHARHVWLVKRADFRERMKSEPDYFDARVAAWWVWGLCQWIGTGWCDVSRQRGDGHPSQQLPHLGNAGMGIHRQLPHLGNAGRGIHRKLPHLGDAGRGYLLGLADRLRHVRVACGDWSRVCGPSVTHRHGLTGVLLDPPYGEGSQQYSAGGNEDASVADAVRAWAIAEGDNPLMRIALCGYDGQHEMPSAWRVVEWKAHGGYASQGGGDNENARRERIWLSPHCLGARQPTLFDTRSA